MSCEKVGYDTSTIAHAREVCKHMFLLLLNSQQIFNIFPIIFNDDGNIRLHLQNRIPDFLHECIVNFIGKNGYRQMAFR